MYNYIQGYTGFQDTFPVGGYKPQGDLPTRGSEHPDLT